MLLNQLRAPVAATKNRKRLGRGEASGLGKTSGRGHKGQKSRSGGYHKVGFEGGQMPLARRLPKRGFTNIFARPYAIINLSDLDKLSAVKEIDLDMLKSKKIIKRVYHGLKVLGHGELKTALTIKAKKFSRTAIEKIERVGGKAVVI